MSLAFCASTRPKNFVLALRFHQSTSSMYSFSASVRFRDAQNSADHQVHAQNVLRRRRSFAVVAADLKDEDPRLRGLVERRRRHPPPPASFLSTFGTLT